MMYGLRQVFKKFETVTKDTRIIINMKSTNVIILCRFKKTPTYTIYNLHLRICRNKKLTQNENKTIQRGS
jgi:hypothetical protein